jgi:mono/diheme cytochrome c family protein
MNALSALCLVLQLAAFHGPDDRNPASLAPRARQILRNHCFECHGKDGAARGGFGYVLDRDRLVARSKIVAGDSSASVMLQRIKHGEMPPRARQARPAPEEIALLQRWIDAGAAAVVEKEFARPNISEAQLARLICADLERMPSAQQKFQRYFSLVPLWNAGRPQAELEAVRQGLSKLQNSLSWHPRVSRPQAIDAAETVYRIDLRAYRWNARRWEQLVAANPYRLGEPSAEWRQIASATGSDWSCLRADWFLATASRPPLYHDLLQLPSTDRDLERQLRVEVLEDIEEESVVRAGFNDSGVSRNNRILERHDSALGAYWRSYDFSDSSERQNIFDHPLGPAPGRDAFASAGGEIIFHLPNGMQAYMLVDRAGRRIDRAPIEIVSDPRRTDRVVENGMSCFSCHARGFLPKADQVRSHVEKNSQAYTLRDVATIKAVYGLEPRIRALLQDDNARYEKALDEAGVRQGDDDPVSNSALAYEGTLDAARAAAELGISTDALLQGLTRSPVLSRSLGTLRLERGTVARQAFLAALTELVREFQLDADYDRNGGKKATPSNQPFAGHSQAITSIAISPGGQWAISGSDDRTIRLWELPNGKQLRTFEGHAGAVLALAIAPDEKRFASAGEDRTIRVWDRTTGETIRQLKGHTDKVRSLAFSPDGKTLLSGGQDRTLRLWNVESGEEQRVLAGHEGAVTAALFAPDGRLIASVSLDRTVRLWDSTTGESVRRWNAGGRAVYAVAFSPDGRLLASGGEDRSVRLWAVKDGTQVRACEGHTNAVVQVAFTNEGKTLLSAASQYRNEDRSIRIWEVAGGKEKGNLAGEKTVTIGCMSFAGDGRSALSGGADGVLKFWKINPN